MMLRSADTKRLAELSFLREYLARHGPPLPLPPSRWETGGGSSVEHLRRVYPSLTEEEIRRALDETPPPDRLWPTEVVSIEAATGHRRLDREPAYPGAEAVVSLGDRRFLKRTRRCVPPPLEEGLAERGMSASRRVC